MFSIHTKLLQACGEWCKPVVAGVSLWYPVQACSSGVSLGRLCEPVVGVANFEVGVASLWWVLPPCGGWCKPVVGVATLWWVLQACGGWCNATVSMYKSAAEKTGVLTTEGIYREFKVDADRA